MYIIKKKQIIKGKKMNLEIGKVIKKINTIQNDIIKVNCTIREKDRFLINLIPNLITKGNKNVLCINCNSFLIGKAIKDLVNG